jgi:hypothetical protein
MYLAALVMDHLTQELFFVPPFFCTLSLVAPFWLANLAYKLPS